MDFSSGDPKVLFKVMFSVEDLRRQPGRWKELELEYINPSEVVCFNERASLPSLSISAGTGIVNKYRLRYVSHLVDLGLYKGLYVANLNYF